MSFTLNQEGSNLTGNMRIMDLEEETIEANEDINKDESVEIDLDTGGDEEEYSPNTAPQNLLPDLTITDVYIDADNGNSITIETLNAGGDIPPYPEYFLSFAAGDTVFWNASMLYSISNSQSPYEAGLSNSVSLGVLGGYMIDFNGSDEITVCIDEAADQNRLGISYPQGRLDQMAQNTVSESDETNNCLTLTYAELHDNQLPDLTISDLFFGETGGLIMRLENLSNSPVPEWESFSGSLSVDNAWYNHVFSTWDSKGTLLDDLFPANSTLDLPYDIGGYFIHLDEEAEFTLCIDEASSQNTAGSMQEQVLPELDETNNCLTMTNREMFDEELPDLTVTDIYLDETGALAFDFENIGDYAMQDWEKLFASLHIVNNGQSIHWNYSSQDNAGTLFDSIYPQGGKMTLTFNGGYLIGMNNDDLITVCIDEAANPNNLGSIMVVNIAPESDETNNCMTVTYGELTK